MTTRREFIQSSASVVLGAAFLPMPSGAQGGTQQPPPDPKFADLRRNVGIFTARGGTIGWLANPDGALAVDAQFPDTAKVCVEGLQPKSPTGIQLLINTHYHGDHTAGNVAFRSAVKTIVQQEKCATLHKDFAAKNNTAANQAFADVTFGESWSVSVGDEKVWARYFGPAHTGGDAIVFFEKANVLHMGDLMFNRLHPRVDRPSGASIKNWASILEKTAQKHKDAMFIFGHAKPGMNVTGTAQDLLSLRDYFTAVLEHVQKGIRAGQSQEQITGTGSLPKFDDYAAMGQILTLKGVLTAAYEELTAKSS